MPLIDPTFIAVIPDGETTSGVVDMRTLTLCGLYIPAAMTGTTLEFLGCDTKDGPFVSVCGTNGGALQITIAEGTYVALDPTNFAGLEFLQIVSGSTELGARSIKLVGKLPP